jgi:Tol biopolymer transport system component
VICLRLFPAAVLSGLVLAVPGAFGGLGPVTGLDNYGPVWSPDGSRFAFTSRDGNTSDIWVMNTDGSGLRDLRVGERLLEMNPAWSPDSKRIAFVAWDTSTTPLPPAAIRVESVDDVRAGTPQIAETDTPFIPLAWSARDQIAYTTGGSVHIVGPNGAGDRIVAAGDSPAWSPSGTQLVLVREGGLWRVDADGSDLRQLAAFDAASPRAPTWSPDGTSVAFDLQRRLAPVPTEIWRVDANGGGLLKLTENYSVSPPSWSPDASRIVFSAARTYEDYRDIYEVSGAGGPLHNITHDNADEENPVWGRSNTLAFNDVWDIFTASPTGTQRRNLTGTRSGLTVRAGTVRRPNRLILDSVVAIVESPPSASSKSRRSVLNLLVHVTDRRGDEVNGALVSATQLTQRRLRLDRAMSRRRTGAVGRALANVVFRRLDCKVHTGTRLVFRIRVTGGRAGTSVDRRVAVVVNTNP